MIISVNSGSKGWSTYVIDGTKKKPRDKSKVYVLDGDLKLGDFLCKQNKYEDSYYSIVIGMKGKPSDEVIEEVYKDFKKHFFKGLYKDEYHIDAVVHKDTDDYHIHVRIPKQNLFTNTHLQLYYDKVDRKRKELIQDYISLKHGFEIARETNRKVLVAGNKIIDSIDKWREEHKKEPFPFKSKKNRKDSEEKVNEYLNELHKKGYIKSQKDIEEELKKLGLKVERFGKDLKKKFSYVTVSNETGKMRIKGEFYSSEFFENTFDERSEQIESNCKEFNVVNNRFLEVEKKLEKENIKRIGRVNQLFSTKRKKIKEEHQNLISQGKQEISGNQEISNEKGVNSDYIRTTVAQGVTRERKVKYGAYKQASESRRTVFGNIKEYFETARRTQQSNLSKIAEIGKLLFKYLTKKIKLNSSELVIQNGLENNIPIENISTNVKRKNRR